MILLQVLEDFSVQRRQGKNPVFKASSIPGLKGTECQVEEK